ncbi:MAG: 16S rRNA (guanine(527)-N(7))-methyltransferase RsmG [Francisellaceae bacterium]
MISIESINNLSNDEHVKIRQAADRMGLKITDQMIRQWLEYLDLLIKWNKTYKMTAITQKSEMLIKHLFDSLSVAHFIKGDNTIDVGSGGGVPGIPLAILMPSHSFTLIDSIGKKTRFLEHVVRTLELANVEVVKARVEQFCPPIEFDNIISRAFSSIGDFYRLTAHLVAAEGGQWLAMKGADIEKENLEILEQRGRLVEIHELEVPFLQAKRHVVVID